MVIDDYSAVTPEIEKLADMCCSNIIPANLYGEYKVNRGLRDVNGNGETDISDVAVLKQYVMKDPITLGPKK